MTEERKKKKQQSLAIEVIKAQSGIEKEIKIHLDKCPTQAVRSIPLTEWTRELCKIARKFKHSDEEIIEWVETYAHEGNWSDKQISYVLIQEEIRRESSHKQPPHPTIGSYHPVELAKTFKKIVVDLSQMEDKDLIDCDYSPDRISEMAENNIREWTTRMNEGELRINKKLVQAITALLKRATELMQQQERNMKLGDMR